MISNEPKIAVVAAALFVFVIVLFFISSGSGPSDANNVTEQETELKYEPLDFNVSIVEKLNDVEDEEFQKNMFYYLTNYIHDETKQKVIRQYLKAYSDHKLITKAFTNTRTPILIYASKLEPNALKSIVFGNLKLHNYPYDYLREYEVSRYRSIDKAIISAHPGFVDSIRNYLAGHLNNEDVLKRGMSFLRANDLINPNFAEDLLENLKDKHYLTEINSKISRAEQRLSDIQKELKNVSNENNKIMTISAFMIADKGDNFYEIRVDGSPAVLHTDVNIYKSKGWFTTYVIRDGSTSVQLKEEYGNFSQSWPLYEEVDREVKEELLQSIYKLKDNVRIINGDLQDAQKELNDVKARLSGFEKRYPNLKEYILTGNKHD
jgi:hypothetical protein